MIAKRFKKCSTLPYLMIICHNNPHDQRIMTFKLMCKIKNTLHKTKGKANSFFQMQLHNLMIFYQIWLSWKLTLCYNAKLLCLFWYFAEKQSTLVPTKPETNQPLGLWAWHVSVCTISEKKPICHACYRSVLYNWRFTLYSSTSGAWMYKKMEGCSSSSWFLLYL